MAIEKRAFVARESDQFNPFPAIMIAVMAGFLLSGALNSWRDNREDATQPQLARMNELAKSPDELPFLRAALIAHDVDGLEGKMSRKQAQAVLNTVERIQRAEADLRQQMPCEVEALIYEQDPGECISASRDTAPSETKNGLDNEG